MCCCEERCFCVVLGRRMHCNVSYGSVTYASDLFEHYSDKLSYCSNSRTILSTSDCSNRLTLDDSSCEWAHKLGLQIVKDIFSPGLLLYTCRSVYWASSASAHFNVNSRTAERRHRWNEMRTVVCIPIAALASLSHRKLTQWLPELHDWYIYTVNYRWLHVQMLYEHV